jgi:predicted phosphodiesterase
MTIRSYINSDNMKVEVTKDHLDIAVQIKVELQNTSPSRKCNWKIHKQMMEDEGYVDSDITESYRQLIKSYQKEVGLLPTLSRHVDFLADGKLQSIRRAVGEIYHEKRENQLVLNELNKLKRELVMSSVIAEEIRDIFIDNTEINVPHYIFEPRLKESGNKAIVTLTDLHVGAVITNVLNNSYNLEIARKRLDRYKYKILDMCNCFNITSLHVCGLGDLIEHMYMRYKQSGEVEFGLAQQILKATELVFEFLVGLAEYVNVDYEGIAGNHDRLQGDKDVSYDNDNANVIINYNIKNLIIANKNKSPRLTFIDTEDHATEINKVINGKKIRLVHGHLDEGNKNDRMKSYISMQEDFFDCLIYGHLHNYKVQESDNGRLIVGVGCVSGRNPYSKKLSFATNASQMMMIVTGEGDLIPIRIDLQIS